MNLNAKYLLEACLLAVGQIILLKFLLDGDYTLFFGTFEQNIVLWVDLQKANGFQRVDHPIILLSILHNPFWLRPQSEDIHS